MVFDEARGRIVLASGQAQGTTVPADVWTYDGVTWTRLANDKGLRRVHHALVYDAARQKVLLIGGADPGVRESGETLELENNAWRANNTLASSVRTHARAYSLHRRALSCWSAAETPAGPVPMFSCRARKAGRHKPAHGRPRVTSLHSPTISSGGSSCSSAAATIRGFLNDTWEWNGSAWRQR
jgi:hypothetical protein